MTKSREVPRPVRSQIIAFTADGRSQREIAALLHIPKSTVADIVKRYRNSGHVSPKKRSGRPPKVSPSLQKKIYTELQKKQEVGVQRTCCRSPPTSSCNGPCFHHSPSFAQTWTPGLRSKEETFHLEGQPSQTDQVCQGSSQLDRCPVAPSTVDRWEKVQQTWKRWPNLREAATARSIPAWMLARDSERQWLQCHDVGMFLRRWPWSDNPTEWECLRSAITGASAGEHSGWLRRWASSRLAIYAGQRTHPQSSHCHGLVWGAKLACNGLATSVTWPKPNWEYVDRDR